MLTHSIQKRKNRTLVRKLLFSLLLFIVSLGICLAVFGYHLLQKPLLLTPLAIQKIAAHDVSATVVSTVKQFCQDAKLSCLSVDITDDNTITIGMEDTVQILLSTQKDLQTQLASLQLTMQQLTIEGKQFKKLDFRFDKAVVTF